MHALGQHGVDVQEVAGQDGGYLYSHELPRHISDVRRSARPSRAATKIRRIPLLPPRVPQAKQPALDAPVPQCAFCRASRSTIVRTSEPAAVPARSEESIPSDQAPVPGQQRARRHDPVRPHVPGQGGQHGTLGPVRARARELAAARPHPS